MPNIRRAEGSSNTSSRCEVVAYSGAMGLEWEPLPTPKRGYEKEYESLFKKLATAAPSRREQLASWFSDVSVAPFETIGAPRVGFDAEADEWLRARGLTQMAGGGSESRRQLRQPPATS